MKKFLLKFAAILAVFTGIAAAQSGTVRIYTQPEGIAFTVDGEFARSTLTAVWPSGTKHVISANPVQEALNVKTHWKFGSWQFAGGTLLGGATVTVTADPSIREFWSTWSVEHALSLNYSACDPDIPCVSPGTIYVNDSPYTGDADIYFSAGASVKLMAVPAPGYVFTGWDPAQNQSATGFFSTVTLIAPTVVRPRFQLARKVNFETVPAELELFADRARIPTPNTQEWGIGTIHTVGAPSPQMAKNGSWWVFSKWSDGGAANHSYTLPPGGGPVTFTATFVPATGTDLRTSPAGLALKVDGRDNWPSYFFTWAAGETHRLEAPQQQTDDRGRLYNFSSWSNGGARIQDYVAPAGVAGSTVTLTANYAAVGHLVVNSAISSLNIKVDGADCAMPCDVQRPVGAVVRLSAPSSLSVDDNTRADFDGWPGSGSLAGEWSVTLGAEPVKPYLTYHRLNRLIAASNPVGGASWRIQPSSSDGYYDPQTTVIVSVSAQPGFRFRHWDGDVSGTASITSVAMNTPRLVEAVFDRVPFIAPAGVANAAGETPEKSVAAGSIVSIFGASFAPDTMVGPDSPMAQALGCVTVRTADRILPLFFVSPSQINLQLPEDMSAGDQKLTVSCLGLPDVQATFTVSRNAPGLFADAKGFAAVTHEDGSAVTPDSPAKRGELLTAFGTGFGPTDHGRPFGFAPPSPYAIVDSATVTAGDVSIPADSAFATAGKIGVDAVQFRLTDAVSAGNVAVHVTVNGKDSNTVLVAVQ